MYNNIKIKYVQYINVHNNTYTCTCTCTCICAVHVQYMYMYMCTCVSLSLMQCKSIKQLLYSHAWFYMHCTCTMYL